MSVLVQAHVWAADLPRKYLLMMLAFADHADDEGRCYPSLKRVAWKCHYTPNHARTIKNDLVEDGWLEIIRKGGRGPGSTDFVQVNVAKLVAARRAEPYGFQGNENRGLRENHGHGTATKRGGYSHEKTKAQQGQTINNHQESSRAGARAREDAHARTRGESRARAPTFGQDFADLSLLRSIADELGVPLASPLEPQQGLIDVAAAADEAYLADKLPAYAVEFLTRWHPYPGKSPIVTSQAGDDDVNDAAA